MLIPRKLIRSSYRLMSAVFWGVVVFNSPSPARAELIVTDWLPDGFSRDGTVSYQSSIQKAIDAAAEKGETLRFPSMVYAVDENGWKLSSGLNLDLRGAKLRVTESCSVDGSVFHGESVSDVTLVGGHIIGRNDVWKDGINIRGVHITGQSSRIGIREMQFSDLSSNGTYS